MECDRVREPVGLALRASSPAEHGSPLRVNQQVQMPKSPIGQKMQTPDWHRAQPPQSAPLGPEAGEAAAVPRDDGRRLDDRERVGPPWPDARGDDPKGAADGAKRRAGPAAFQYGELLPEHQDLDDEARARAKGGDERAEQGRDDREHDQRR